MIRTTLDGITEPVETLIIGSGPAGLTLAMELARHGRPSLVLESGSASRSDAQDLSAADIIDPSRHDDMSVAVARQLGGTSNLWGGRCMPLDPVDFVPRAYAQNAAWPITQEDIAPYYGIACGYTTCGASVFEAPLLGYEATPGFTLATIERASNVPRFARAHRATIVSSPLIDLRLNASVVDLSLTENGTVAQAVLVDAARQATTIAAKRFVIAAGGLESTRLLLSMQRKHPALFGGRDGPLGRHYMGHIIGEVADIVFANDRIDAAFDFFRDGHGSFVRRRMMPHATLQAERGLPNICFWPVVPPIADARHKSGALSAVAMALSTPGLGPRLVPEAIRTRHLDGAIDWRAHAGNVVRDLPRTARFLTRFVHQRYLSKERVSGYFLRNSARRYGLSYSSEQSPRAESRVWLTAATDRVGLPRLAIDLRFHRDDAEAIARAHVALGESLTAVSAGEIVLRQGPEATADAILARAAHGTHQIGLARMGSSRGQGVVDRDLCCFDVANLYVASSAVFPTSGQANPTLSIVAFSARLAAKLAEVPL